jgi:hypothetical protein
VGHLGAAPLAAQRVRELGVQAIGTLSDPGLAVAGVYGALRPSARTRVSVSAGAGVSGGEAAGRGELLGHFLVSPGATRGVGAYAAAGVAVVAGPVGRGYLVLSLGLEGSPGASQGWAVEAGVGGGARVGLGWRWRWPGAGREWESR